jgi:hypothetical protein
MLIIRSMKNGAKRRIKIYIYKNRKRERGTERRRQIGAAM